MPTRARRNPAVAAARRPSRATVRDRGNRAVPRRREPILTLQYWREGRWYVGELVEAPDVFSQGRTLDELRRNMLDAWELMLKERPHPGLAPRHTEIADGIVRRIRKQLAIRPPAP